MIYSEWQIRIARIAIKWSHDTYLHSLNRTAGALALGVYKTAPSSLPKGTQSITWHRPYARRRKPLKSQPVPTRLQPVAPSTHHTKRHVFSWWIFPLVEHQWVYPSWLLRFSSILFLSLKRVFLVVTTCFNFSFSRCSMILEAWSRSDDRVRELTYFRAGVLIGSSVMTGIFKVRLVTRIILMSWFIGRAC